MAGQVSWDQIVRSDHYQQLDEKSRSTLEDRFFEANVAPRIDQKHHGLARERMRAYTPARVQGDVVRDIGATAGKAGVSAGQGLWELADAASELSSLAFGGIRGLTTLAKTGDMQAAKDAWLDVKGIDEFTRSLSADGRSVSERLNQYREFYDDVASDTTRIKQQQLAQAGGDADDLAGNVKGYVDALSYLAKNPDLLAMIGAESAGQYLIGAGVAGKVGNRAFRATKERLMKQGLDEKIATAKARVEAIKQGGAASMLVEGATEGGFSGAEAGSIIMDLPDEALQKAPAFQELIAAGKTPQQAKQALAREANSYATGIAAAVSMASSKIVGSERLKARIFSGIPTGPDNIANRVLKSTAVEGLQESVQEGGAQFATNVGVQQTGQPDRGWGQGVGGAAGTGAAAGGVMGAGAGLLSRRGDIEPVDEIDQAIADVAERRAPPSRVGGSNPSSIITPESDGEPTTPDVLDSDAEAMLFGDESAAGSVDGVPTPDEATAQGTEPSPGIATPEPPDSVSPAKQQEQAPAQGASSLEGDEASADAIDGRTFVDPRLRRPEHRGRLQAMAGELQRGGDVQFLNERELPVNANKAVGDGMESRTTPSVNPPWFQALAAETEFKGAVSDYQRAVAKALSGERLGVRQERIVRAMLDEVTGERTDYAKSVREQMERARELRKGIRRDGYDNPSNYFEEADYDDHMDVDRRTLYEMVEQANAFDPDETDRVLDVGEDVSDYAIAEQLAEIINRGQNETSQALDADDESARARGDEYRADAPGETAGQQSARAQTQGAEDSRRSGKPELTSVDDLANEALAPGAGADQPPSPGRRDATGPGVRTGSEVSGQPGPDEDNAGPGGRAPRANVSGSGKSDPDEITTAANEAATSPANALPEPTEAQKEAGNYKVGRVRVHGLDISIENPRGSTRRGTDPGGNAWEQALSDHYGYIRGTVGRDKDHVDVFVADNPEASARVYVVDQVNPDGSFDEHKVMLGYPDKIKALQAYRRNYARGWKGMGEITGMSVDKFREWLKSGDTTKPVALANPGKPEATAPKKKSRAKTDKEWLDAKQKQLGVWLDDVVTFSRDIGYASAGRQYLVESVGKSGIRVKNLDRGTGTSLSWRELRLAVERGTKIERSEGLTTQSNADLQAKDAQTAAAAPRQIEADNPEHFALQPQTMTQEQSDATAEAGAKANQTDMLGIKAEDVQNPAPARDVDPGVGGGLFAGAASPREQIQAWADGKLASNVIINIAHKGDVFERVGIKPGPFALKQSVLKKARERHGLSDEALLSIPDGVATPLAIFDDPDIAGTRVLVTRVQSAGENVIAAVRIGEDGATINDIRSVHPKRDESIRRWIDDGLLLAVENDEGRKWLDNSAGTNPLQSPAKAANALMIFDRFGRVQSESPAKPTGGDAARTGKEQDGARSGPEQKIEDSGVETSSAEGSQDVDPADAILEVEAVIEAAREGKVTAEQFRAAYQRFKTDADEIRAALASKTKKELLANLPPFSRDRYKNDKKDVVVRVAFDAMKASFSLGQEYGPSGYFMGEHEKYARQKDEALAELVEATTDEALAAYAERIANARAEYRQRIDDMKASVQDPKTLDDFDKYMRFMASQGKSIAESRAGLTPEQKESYDRMAAERSRAKRSKPVPSVEVAGQAVGAEIVETTHTKKGHDLFVVRLAERLERDDYNRLNASAKQMGGYYSSYRAQGAVPGFQFRDREAAEAFKKLAAGDSEAASTAVQARADAFVDDKSQTAVQRLNTMADRLEALADESLNADRKQNTRRRAEQAAGAIAKAEAEKAQAITMRRVAKAIESGDAQFLDRVRERTQVALLDQYVRTAKGDELRAKYPEYRDQIKNEGEPPTGETAEFAKFPSYTAFRSDLAAMGRRMLEIDGLKKLGQQVMKRADDVSEAYTDFAKENLDRVSKFALKSGSRAVLPSRQAAESAIRHNGLTGKAIVLPIKRGQNAIVLSPSAAMDAGIWDGDRDKRITLPPSLGDEIAQKAKRHGGQIDVPWVFDTMSDRRKVLARMGIETPAEFRSALREYIALREQPAAPDKIKAMERKLVGRRDDGLDFFPTPASIAEQMIETAGIEEGMRVLEPSAGMGHIADQIRAAGVEPDVVEMGSSNRELLEAKGYEISGHDFLELTQSGGTSDDLASVESELADLNEKIVSSLNRNGPRSERQRWDEKKDDLAARRRVLRKESSAGYDRIIMNPPFSKNRDIEHVRHAYGLLKPGGRVVAIMGEGAFFRQDKKASQFRDWLGSVGGTSEKLEDGTFLDSSLPVTTGVSTRMVVIDKSAESDKPSYSRQDGKRGYGSFDPAEDAITLSRPQARLTGRGKGRVTEGSKRLAQHIQRWQGVSADEGKVVEVALPDAVPARRFLDATGKRVVVFRSEHPAYEFNGAAFPGDPDTLYVNEASEYPIDAVVGHELTHALKRDEPDLYARLEQAALDHLADAPGDYANWLRNEAAKADADMTDAQVMEEVVSDYVGSQFRTRRLWQRLYDQDASLAKRLANWVRDWLTKFLDGFKGKRLKGTVYVRDVETMRKTVDDVLREYEGRKASGSRSGATALDSPIFKTRASGVDVSRLFARFHTDKPASFTRVVDGVREVMGLSVDVPIVFRDDPDPAAAPMYFDGDAGVIAVNRLRIKVPSEAASYLVEEYLHALDAAFGGRSIAAGSPRFAPGGDLFEEAGSVTDDDYKRFLKYPLDEPMNQGETAAELFARLGALYHGNQPLFRQHFPEAARYYDAISFTIRAQRERSDDSVSGQVRGAAAKARDHRRSSDEQLARSGESLFAGSRGWKTDPGLGAIQRSLARRGNANVLGRKVTRRLRTQETPPSAGSSDSGPVLSRMSKRRSDDPAMRESMRKAGTLGAELPLGERLTAGVSAIWDQAKTFGREFQSGTFDAFRAIRDAEGNIDPERSGYIAARLSTGASSVMYGAMLYGTPEWRGGMVTRKPKSKGLTKVLEPVSDDINAFISWMVAKRAEYLASEAGGYRENNLTLEDISRLKSLAGDREAEYEAVASEFRDFNTAMLELARDGGLLSQAQVDAFSSDAYYVPFYRQDDDGDVTRPFTNRGLSHQSAGVRQLKGGAQALNDPLENVFANMARLIDASMKNHALYRTLMSNPQIATRASMSRNAGKKDRVVQVMNRGKPYKFEIRDPAMFRALTAIGQESRTGHAIEFGRWTKRLLTTGVTAEPTFMLRNFIRDMMHAWTIDKNGFRFAMDSARGVSATVRTMREAAGDPENADPVVMSMMFAGASFLGGYVYGTDPAKNAAALRRSLRRKGMSASKADAYMGSLVSTPAEFWAKYRDFGDAVENANRVAVAKAALAAGKSELEAVFDAKDLMDYSLRGQWAVIQVMADVLPFFNARLQGMYKLGREMVREPGADTYKKIAANLTGQIARKGAWIALASIVLAAVNEDDDDYQALEDWDKDANWHLFLGGTHIRIPKPFELGILFGTVPERLWMLGRGQNDLNDSGRALAHALTTTLAINPIPQAVRPGAEVFFNWDMFRERPVEGMADQGKLPEDRYSSYTSPTMVAIGKQLGLSPKKLEHIWNGHLGTLGGYALSIPDTMFRWSQPGETPDIGVGDLPVLGSFVKTGPAWSTRYGTEMYKMSRDAEQIYRSLRDRAEKGEDWESLQEDPDNLRLLMGRDALRYARQAVSGLRKQKDVIRADTTLSGAEKKQQLDDIQRRINELQKTVVEKMENQ